MIETKLINLFAGPSSGKTTAASGLFHFMKHQRMNIEVAPEYAKDLVWEKNWESLDDQLHIFGEQHRRIYRLLGKVDYIITDSPLLFSLVYGAEGLKKYKGDNNWFLSFTEMVVSIHHQYDNYNFFVQRGDRKYIREGRTQDLNSAKRKDEQILTMLDNNYISYTCVNDYNEILNDLGLS